MVVLLATMLAAGPAAGWETSTPISSLDGEATYYASGVMATVAANRGLVAEPGEFPAWLETQGYVGAVALNRAGDLGRQVWLQGPAGLVEGPFLVIDCAHPDLWLDREQRGRVVEVDWETARRWQMRGPVVVQVFFLPPFCPYSFCKVPMVPL